MKNILFAAILLYTCSGALAQNKDHSRYQLPDGKVVAGDKLDSVQKAWGNHGFLMSHDQKQPELIHLSPMTDAFTKQMDAEKADLKKLMNQRAPDFALSDLSGKKWTLAGLKGKTVVLNFWFTTCPGCIQEMPNLNKLKKSYAGTPVVFLALALDNAAAIQKFLKSHAYNYTLLTEAQHVSKDYHVNSYPTSMVIDPQGIIRFQQVGGENIEQQITAAIKQVSKSS